MGFIKIFTKVKCPKCPAAKKIVTTLEREGVRVVEFDLDTTEGLAEASFCSVRSTPSIIIEDAEEKEIMGWRGIVPTLQEVRRHLVGLR
jgi:glutaredoxin